MLKAILTLIYCLPEILKMIERLDEKNTELGVQTKVKDDLKVINEAFDEMDNEKLRRVFNS